MVKFRSTGSSTWIHQRGDLLYAGRAPESPRLALRLESGHVLQVFSRQHVGRLAADITL
jgi:hypothetical protein